MRACETRHAGGQFSTLLSPAFQNDIDLQQFCFVTSAVNSIEWFKASPPKTLLADPDQSSGFRASAMALEVSAKVRPEAGLVSRASSSAKEDQASKVAGRSVG